MKKVILCKIVLMVVSILFVSNCHAQAIPSSDLINNARQYDGKIVTYKGEIVGEAMIRKEHAWLNVNDGYIAIGVWIDKKSIKDIKYTGDYRTKGDTIEVTGIFMRSCPEHGGDLDIHCQVIRKISSGGPIQHPVDAKKTLIALFLSAVALLACFIRKAIPLFKHRI